MWAMRPAQRRQAARRGELVASWDRANNDSTEEGKRESRTLSGSGATQPVISSASQTPCGRVLASIIQITRRGIPAA